MTQKTELGSTSNWRECQVILKWNLNLPLVANIPHSSTSIPPLFRSLFLLAMANLSESCCCSNRYVDELFSGVCEIGGALGEYTQKNNFRDV